MLRKKKYDELLKDIDINPEEVETKRVTTSIERPMGKFDVFLPVSLQTDVIYMPNDRGYKYILSIINLKTHKADAEPMKEIKAENIKNALIAMVNRNICNCENVKIIHANKGKEFENKLIIDWLKQVGWEIHFGRTNRHSQQGPVEFLNYTIKKVLWGKMTIEKDKNIPATKWLEDLPRLIKGINNNITLKPEPISHYFNKPNILKGEKILKEGSVVNIMKDYPTEDGKRIYGNIRAGEAHYENINRKIERICIYPNQRVRYQVTGITNATFQRGQLLVV